MAVGLYAVGRHLTVVTLTPQTANASTGVLSPGTAITITGLVDEMEAEEQVTTEEISPITTARENHVGIMYGARMRVAEILTTPGFVANVRGPQLLGLKATLLAVGYCKVNWIHGNTPHEFLGLYERMSSPWRGKGKQVVTVSFVPVDNGVDNWLVA